MPFLDIASISLVRHKQGHADRRLVWERLLVGESHKRQDRFSTGRLWAGRHLPSLWEVSLCRHPSIVISGVLVTSACPIAVVSSMDLLDAGDLTQCQLSIWGSGLVIGWSPPVNVHQRHWAFTSHGSSHGFPLSMCTNGPGRSEKLYLTPSIPSSQEGLT
jgi:hypothetical protein